MSKKISSAGLRRLGGNCVVPEGTRYFFSFHPGLMPWAKTNAAPPPPHFAQKRRELGTPAAGLDFAQSFNRANSERVLTHALQPPREISLRVKNPSPSVAKAIMITATLRHGLKPCPFKNFTPA